jgi:hypothetical protein
VLLSLQWQVLQHKLHYAVQLTHSQSLRGTGR